MNIIREQREDIIKNNNTAQTHLLNVLETSNKTAQRLRIIEPLHGDLDFSILSEYGFTTIKDITLSKGEITSVTGLPSGLMSFICIDNLLFELDNLPRGLRNIDITHNFLTSIDVSDLKQLETLFISDNKISKLENLPTSLTMLRCDNNQLTTLNLLGLDALDQLHISTNPITIIDNLPEGIYDFKMENTPSIEFRNSPVIPINRKDTSDESKHNYIEALNEYFHLKNNYESKIHKAKKKIHEKFTSKRAAQKEAIKLKPACIKCSRPVGTIFSKKDNRYIAICGDSQNPCKLDIQLFSGTTLPLALILYSIKKLVDKSKNRIIGEKLDALFNYVNEADSILFFKKELKTYNLNSETFKELLDKQNDAFFSTQKKEQVEKKLGEIFQLIEKNRLLLAEYAKTENNEILKAAVELQIKELLPETRNLRMLKNEIMELHHVKHANTIEHNLFQYPCALSKLDDVFGEPPRVIKFDK